MHGGLELVREEGYVLDFNRTKDFNRTESTAHEAESDGGKQVGSTNARGNVVEFDANRKAKKAGQCESAGGSPAKCERAED